MTKDKIYDVALGVAAVVLLYAVVRKKMPRASGGTGGGNSGGSVFSTWNPFNPDPGITYDPANPAQFISLSDLIKGTVNDFFTGNSGTQYPWLSDIKQQAVEDYYGNTTSGNSARDNGSVVFKPGTYW
uniref:Uncharacterized protein n=1 Tax=Corticoviridae sp. TaxID=2832474 RepID=A0A8D9PDZ1_9VIRU|nr:MAG TPA: hypothetical protein [Corticoviridae sp.]